MRKTITIVLLTIILMLLIGNTISFAESKANYATISEINYLEEEISSRIYSSSSLARLESYYNNIKHNFEGNPMYSDFLEDIFAYSKSYYDVKIDYTQVLYDLNADRKGNYLLAQFSNGGYAIMNRETKTIYERSESGMNPYSEYRNKKCFYAGPSAYIYQDKELTDILSNKVLTNNNRTLLANNMQDIVQRDLEQLKYEVAEEEAGLKSTSWDSTGWHNLGEGTPTGDDMLDFVRMVYFYLLDASLRTYTPTTNGFYFTVDANFSKAGLWHFMMVETSGGSYVDAPIPVNTFGSCTMVAMTMILQYYNRLELFNTVPSNMNNWTSLYSFNTMDWVSNYSPSVTNPSNTQSEKIHQYLIKLTCPNAVLYPTLDLGASVADISQATANYFNNNPSATAADINYGGATTIANRKFLAEIIYMGDPVLLGIDYNGNHAVVAYGYNMERYVKRRFFGFPIYDQRVKEYVVNLGLTANDTSHIIIDASTVNSFSVLRYFS